MALVPFPTQNRDEEQNLPAKPGGFFPFGDDEEPAGEGRMTFLEHLDELRKRITHAVVGLLVGFVISSSTLFIAGAAFSHYFVFPAAWTFFASFSNDYIAFTPRIDPVFGMYVKLMLGIGLTFQLPVLMFVLARLGIVTAGFLLRNFKYAVLLIFIFAAVITPDGNPVTQVMVGGPMVVLYVLGIAAAWLFGKSKKPDPEE